MTGKKAVKGARERLRGKPANNLPEKKLREIVAKDSRNTWGQGWYDSWKQGD